MIDQYRARVIRAAMHNAMADSHGIYIEFVAEPGAGDGHRGRHIANGLDRIGPVRQRIAGRPGGAQSWTSTNPVHLSLDLPPQTALAFHREDLELHAGGAGIDDKDRVHGGHAAAIGVIRRRASANNAATAAEAIRARAESARDVSTIGTRAPSTMPAPSAFAKYARFFASMLPDSRSGTTRICARPATSDLMPLILAASTSMALSKASGPSNTAPVIWPRSAILHSAAASMVDGIADVTVSTADRIATRGVAPNPA